MKLLLLNQYYAPDVASTAQHAADLARAMAAEGHAVTVVAGRSSYGNSRQFYPSRETRDGVHIVRVGGTGFGKSRAWRRILDCATFLLLCAWRILRMPRFDVVVAMTTPPLLSVLAVLLRWFHGGAVHIWLMDLNPDEAIAMGWLRPMGAAARLLEALHRYSLRRAAGIVVLDRFMRRRIEAKGIAAGKIAVVPPWSHDVVHWDPAGRSAFRHRHGLEEKFVVMYSGNHSPCHPLDPLLEAARRLREYTDLAFCFIGGGGDFAKVQAFAQTHRLENMLCLPYQPLEAVSASLSAADLHVVAMGHPLVGIVHPCKIYNILSLGIPVLYMGPAESHIGDLGASPWLLPAAGAEEVVRQIVAARARGSQRYESEILQAREFSPQRQLTRLVRALWPENSGLRRTAEKTCSFS